MESSNSCDAMLFHESPLRVSKEELYRRVDELEIHDIQREGSSTLLGFKKEGKRNGTKAVSKYLAAEKIKLKSGMVDDMVKMIRESRTICEANVLASSTGCLNFYYIHSDFWAEVAKGRYQCKSFTGGSGTLSYVDLIWEHEGLGPNQAWASTSVSWAMNWAEEKCH